MRSLEARDPVQDLLAKALHAGDKGSFGSSMTDGTSAFLHGSRLFQYAPGRESFMFSMAGWDTRQTRRYLNSLLSRFDMSVVKKEGENYIRISAFPLRPISLDEVVYVGRVHDEIVYESLEQTNPLYKAFVG